MSKEDSRLRIAEMSRPEESHDDASSVDLNDPFDHEMGGMNDGCGESQNFDTGPIPLTSKEKRKERNKLLARKSRMKLKADLENLKAKLMYLMKENESLRSQLYRVSTPPVSAEALLHEDFILPENIESLVQQLLARTARGSAPPHRLKTVSFCISNAISPDMPLVYASPGFLKLTGYEMHEILGRNCRFLQGPRTDPTEVAKVSRALAEGRDYSTVLLNYRKDGRTFWNQILLSHVKDRAGRTFFVVGIQTQVKPVSMSGNFPSSSSNTSTAMEVDHPPAAGDHCLSSEIIMEASSGSGRTTGSGEDVFVVLHHLLSSTSTSPVLQVALSKLDKAFGIALFCFFIELIFLVLLAAC
eukprot:scaffold735_cov159-Ochromonas_danica.AAC.3